MKIIDFSRTNTVLNQYVTELRDINIQNDSLRFRRNVERIGQILAYEISKDLPYQDVTVQTPLAPSTQSVPAVQPVIATILRAGLPFHQGFHQTFDRAENAFVSAYRAYSNKKDFEVHIEYIASPHLDGKTLILTDPMLATGASMELSYRALLTKGEPAHVHIAAIIASQPAIDYIVERFPADKTTIWCAAVDPELNEHAYIVPGLGDAGDLCYGEKA